MTEAEFRALALSLPGVVEGFNMRSTVFKVNGKDLCRLLDAEHAMLTGISSDESDHLTEARPDVFRTNAHFRDARCLGVTLPRISREAITPFVERRFREIARRIDVKAWEATRATA